MDLFSSLLSVCLLLVLAETTLGQGPCFQFQGNAYISFSSNRNFNNSNRIHYQMMFKTTSPNGIIMYSKGSYGDKEALYVRDGNLNYQLYNRAINGIGRQFGGHFVTDQRVDDDEWITVHLYRSWVIPARPPQSSTVKTGIEIVKGGATYSYTDNQVREHVDLSSTVYFGGCREQLNSSIGYFDGLIQDIREEKNGIVFENPSLNYESKVGLSCPDPFVV